MRNREAAIGYPGMGDLNTWESSWCDALWWPDLEDVDEELLVDGEECDHDSDRDEVSEEKDDDPECFEPKPVVVRITRFPMAFSVLFKAISTISIVHTLCCCVRCCDRGEFPPAAKFKFNSRLDSSSSDELGSARGWAPGLPVLFRLKMLRSSSWRFHSCLPVENESSCCPTGLLSRGLAPPEEVDDVEVLKLSSRSVSDRLLPRNSCARGEAAGTTSAAAGVIITMTVCCTLRGSSLVLTPVLLFRKYSSPVCTACRNTKNNQPHVIPSPHDHEQTKQKTHNSLQYPQSHSWSALRYMLEATI